MAEQYGSSRFTLTAEIAGETHQLVQFQMSFALNAVPKATALMAVGRNARNVSEVAPIHRVGSQLIYLQPAKIYMEAIGVFAADGTTWPDGRTLLFDGYLTGVSYRRSEGSVMLALDFTHWLADLQFSSMLSDISHPNNPHSYTHRAAFTLSGAGGNDLPTWLADWAPTEFTSLENLKSDLWGNTLQPLFCKLAEEDLYSIEGADPAGECFSREGGGNRQALTALKRMVGGGCGISSSESYVPLTLQSGALGNELAEAISSGIMRTISNADFFQSFWDNLTVRLGPQFCFSVVPQIDKAFCAPVIPGLRTTWHREILATDQGYVDMSSTLPRPLRAVAMYNTAEADCQANQAQATPAFDIGSGGCFAPEGAAEAQGQVLVVRAPFWLSSIPAAIELTGATNSVYDKGATTPGGGGPKAPKPPSDARKESKQLANWYCQYLYMCEALRGRNGTVSGKFRLDIAPGSTIRVHGNPERFLGGEDTLGVNMIGLVHTVTCALDAEQQKAGTGFGLTHLRTEDENEDDKTSIPIHPLFAQAYTGAPLIDSQSFRAPGGNVLSGAPTQDVSGIA